MRAGFSLAVALFVCLPIQVHAGIVKGPFLQDVRTGSVVVGCETDGSASCTVEWGQGFANSTALSASGNHHEGTVNGLTPSTCYPYRVSCSGQTSAEGSFCAGPEPGEPFRFVLFGDTRSDHAAHQQVVDRILAEGVDFFINTGDLVSSGEEETDWVEFFQVEDALLLNTPLYPVVGNHDEDNGDLSIYERLFAPSTGSSGKESYYSFTYGNARFIAIDNQASALWGVNLDVTQKNWALAEMDTAQADPDIDHIFVMAHENMYSSKDGRSGDWVLRSMRDDMKAKGVDYVFSGHDHYYDRGVADNGLPYVISGGGGAPVYDTENPTEGDPVNVAYPAHTVYYSKALRHYLVIEIHGEYFSACAKDSSGVAFDCFSYGEQPQPDGGVDAGPDGGDPGFDGGVDGGVDGDAGEDGGLDGGADEGPPADQNPCNMCVGEPYDPVCGEDGVTYDNLCLLDCHQMGMEYEGPCQGDPCDRCPQDEAPVCGEDDKTYLNQCLMECMGVRGVHAGPCQTGECTDCPDTDQPVCGKDGTTYKNQCLMECMGVEGAHAGPCVEDGSSCNCSSRGAPRGGWLLLLVPALFRIGRRRRLR